MKGKLREFPSEEKLFHFIPITWFQISSTGLDSAVSNIGYDLWEMSSALRGDGSGGG